MWREALLVAGKDLRIEMRSRVSTNQVVPFAMLVLLLFAFALDPDRGLLRRAAPGLFWIAVLFACILAVQRSFGLESADQARDSLRLAALDPAAIFLGKAGALLVQLLMLELFLAIGVVVFYNTALGGIPWLVIASVLATLGLAAAGSIYGVLAASLKVRDTLLPLLLLPVVAPVLLAATRFWESAISGNPGGGSAWLQLLGVYALVYLCFGILAFGSLLEES